MYFGALKNWYDTIYYLLLFKYRNWHSNKRTKPSKTKQISFEKKIKYTFGKEKIVAKNDLLFINIIEHMKIKNIQDEKILFITFLLIALE